MNTEVSAHNDLRAQSCLVDSAFSQQNRLHFRKHGFLALEDALAPGVASQVLSDLSGQNYLEVESPNSRLGATRFFSKNGPRLLSLSPLISVLESDILKLTNHVAEEEYTLLDNRDIGVSVNITPPGGGFATHFDRQEVSAVAYLNEVQGGMLEIWPRLRTWASPLPVGFEKRGTLALTKLVRPVRIKPRAGTVIVFTKTTPHRVAGVEGDKFRVSVVFAYDRPGVSFLQGQTYYGYGEETKTIQDLV